MNDPGAAAELLRDLIGQRLLAVTEARFWFEGQRDDDAASLLDFWLHFEGKPTLMAHGCGEDLSLELVGPYPSYEMQECGETRVGPAQEPDLLALGHWAATARCFSHPRLHNTTVGRRSPTAVRIPRPGGGFARG